MDDWLFVLLTLLLSSYLTKLLLTKLQKSAQKNPLPPGPKSIPIVTPILWLTRSFKNFTSVIRELHRKHGPIVLLNLASRPVIFISDRHVAHQALVQQGADFSDRPAASPAGRVLSTNQISINTAHYGPVWRLLRRNLTAEILHPTRVKIYAGARRWVLDVLLAELRRRGPIVAVMDSFQYAMFCLLVLMCFGEKLEQGYIVEILTVQRQLLSNFLKFNVFAIFPRITKVLFRKRWEKLLAIRATQESLFLPLIKKRRGLKNEKQEQDSGGDSFVYSYVDSLIDVQLPESDGGKRNLSDGEIVSLCSEFLSAGTDTTSTALQWIMANLVKQQEIQEKVYKEIEEAVGGDADVVKEEDLSKMAYLKAVVLEGLRRHPPGHFLLPHTVTEDVVLNGYLVPKGTGVNVTVADIGWDGKVWDEPMEFRPERFLDGGEGFGVDLTGSREVKMMPFGVGRRICPGMGLALLHLEYFLANLVREFEWLPVDGEDVDLTETQDFTVVMKNPLRARILPRKRSAVAEG